MLTLKTTQEGQETRQTITDERGQVIAKVGYWDWSEPSVAAADKILACQLLGAGYTWKDVEQE